MSFISTEEAKIVAGIKSEFSKLGADAKHEVAVATSFVAAHAFWFPLGAFALGNVLGAILGF